MKKAKPQTDKHQTAAGASYMKYSGLALQIVLTILLLAWGGHYLDVQTGNQKPWFTLIGSVTGLIGSMIYLIQRVSKDK